jgi:hypothetical protein
MSKVQKRVQKSKKEIISSIQLNQNAEKVRSIIKGKVYPFLTKDPESISYCKLFLQSLSGLVSGVYEEKAKVITINDLLPRLTERLNEIFQISDKVQKKEYERYLGFLTELKELSVHDLTYITELPRYIDGLLLLKSGKEKISTISIDELLG